MKIAKLNCAIILDIVRTRHAPHPADFWSPHRKRRNPYPSEKVCARNRIFYIRNTVQGQPVRMSIPLSPHQREACHVWPDETVSHPHPEEFVRQMPAGFRITGDLAQFLVERIVAPAPVNFQSSQIRRQTEQPSSPDPPPVSGRFPACSFPLAVCKKNVFRCGSCLSQIRQ